MRRDATGSGNGGVSVQIQDMSIVVGCRYAMTVVFTAGRRGVAVGGCLRFKLPGMDVEDEGRAPVSCSNPRVRLVCSNRIPRINGKDGKEFFTLDYLFVTVEDEPLREGDIVSVRYGENLAKERMRAPRMAQKWNVEVATDLEGARDAPGSGFFLVSDPPELEFVSDSAFYAEVTIPSSTRVNEAFETVVRLRDKYQNLAEHYRGTVALAQGFFEKPTILQRYTYTQDDCGVHAFQGTILRRTGINRLLAIAEDAAICARSNPTRTTDGAARPFSLYWGDTHCHSCFSADSSAGNCLIPEPQGGYDYARDRSDLDFCMVTDHVENLSEEEWRETRNAADRAYEPDAFVAFSSFEATFQPSRKNGDKNVYFFRTGEERINGGTTEELYRSLKERGTQVMVIPHVHCMTNWDLHDPELERVVEIYSHWGCGLSPESIPPIIPGSRGSREHYVSHALERGARLGFIASADHSSGHPGDDFWWPLSSYNGGLAAVYGSALTREGVWDGLWSRRCYATTRARILLEFELNGHMMGEELQIPPGDPQTRCLKIGAYGTNPLERLEIVKNSRVLESVSLHGELDIELSYTDTKTEREVDYYYVHVVQADGEQAWSSPIWVTEFVV